MERSKIREEYFQQKVGMLRQELDKFLEGEPLAPDFEERLNQLKEEEKEILDQLLARHKIDLSEKESTVKIEKLDVLGPGSSQGYIKDYIQIRPDLYLCLTSKRSIQLLYIIERDGNHRVQWSLPVQGLDRSIFHQEADQIKAATREKGSLENQQKEIREELYLDQQGKLILEEIVQEKSYQKEIQVPQGVFLNQVISFKPGYYLGIDLDGRVHGLEVQTLRGGEDLWRMKL